jgi:MFS family permease
MKILSLKEYINSFKAEKTNIKVSYFISFLSQLYFPIAAWLFFYLQFLDFKQISILLAVHIISSNLFEIPTGAFADLYGRRKAIFLAFFACTFLMFIFPFVSSFWIFIVLEILGAITKALLSGSVEALVYDTLKENGEEERYNKVVANMTSFAWIGLFIFKLWIPIPWILQGIVFGIAAFASLKLVEPTIDTKKYEIKDIFIQNIIGFKELFKNFQISRITILFIIIASGYVVAGNVLGISQAKDYGLESNGVGILFAIGYIISAFVSQISLKLQNKFGNNNLLIGVTIILLSSFIFAKFSVLFIGLGLIIARISSSPIFWNITSTTLNPLISSKNRATSLSTFSLLTQLPYAVMAFTIGDYIDRTSPNEVAFLLGIVIFGAILLSLIIFNNSFTKKG